MFRNTVVASLFLYGAKGIKLQTAFNADEQAIIYNQMQLEQVAAQAAAQTPQSDVHSPHSLAQIGSVSSFNADEQAIIYNQQ